MPYADPQVGRAKARERYRRNREACLATVRQYRILNAKKIRAAKRLYYLSNKERIRQYSAEYRRKNPGKVRCHRIMWRAIRAGELAIGPCGHPRCTNRAEAHHEDYDKPLDVTWMCASHHQQHHWSIR